MKAPAKYTKSDLKRRYELERGRREECEMKMELIRDILWTLVIRAGGSVSLKDPDLYPEGERFMKVLLDRNPNPTEVTVKALLKEKTVNTEATNDQPVDPDPLGHPVRSEESNTGDGAD